jgi:hypothetical protein
MRATLALPPLLFAAIAAACAHGKSPGPPAPSVHDSIAVHVVNQNYYDATIYWVYQGEARRRLGIVQGNQSELMFKVPWGPRSLAFDVDLIVGTGVYRSQEVSVSPGDVVELTLPPNIQSSGFFHRIGD